MAETMARTLWPGEDPVGKRIEDSDPARAKWLQVVGVVNDVESTIDFVQPPSSRFQVYIPLEQTPSGFVHWLNLAIRSDAPGPTLTAALRAAMLSIDPDQPISAVISAPEGIEQIMRGFTLTADLLTVFSLIGLALSAVGIYGVIANLVAQRTAEIGIRMALGAQARDVLWLVLGQGVRLSIAGSAIGLACAWGLNQLLHSLLPAIPGGDPLALAVLVALLTSVALFACWLPARRATRQPHHRAALSGSARAGQRGHFPHEIRISPAPEEPGLHGGRPADPRPGDRRQHDDLHPDERAALPPPVDPRAGPPRGDLRHHAPEPDRDAVAGKCPGRAQTGHVLRAGRALVLPGLQHGAAGGAREPRERSLGWRQLLCRPRGAASPREDPRSLGRGTGPLRRGRRQRAILEGEPGRRPERGRQNRAHRRQASHRRGGHAQRRPGLHVVRPGRRLAARRVRRGWLADPQQRLAQCDRKAEVRRGRGPGAVRDGHDRSARSARLPRRQRPARHPRRPLQDRTSGRRGDRSHGSSWR